jgi:mRNA-degrading endonuclease toxin of MazEF toxin-antitoxin module
LPEHVVVTAADQPLVGFVDCMTPRLASKRHLVHRVGVLSAGTMRRVEDGIRAALGFGS